MSRWKKQRDTRDDSLPRCGKLRSQRLDLGLELLVLAREPGATFTAHDIAAWSGCTNAAIQRIQRIALKKLTNALRFGRRRGICAELGAGRPRQDIRLQINSRRVA